MISYKYIGGGGLITNSVNITNYYFSLSLLHESLQADFLDNMAMVKLVIKCD